jgi:hypothetical protein
MLMDYIYSEDPRNQHAGLQAFVRYYISTPALEDVPLLVAGPTAPTK